MFEFLNPIYHQNSIQNRGDFYISYNPHTDTGLDETAIVASGKFLILNGDHRENYQKCNSLKDCIAYFQMQREEESSWSNSVDEFLDAVRDAGLLREATND